MSSRMSLVVSRTGSILQQMIEMVLCFMDRSDPQMRIIMIGRLPRLRSCRSPGREITFWVMVGAEVLANQKFIFSFNFLSSSEILINTINRQCLWNVSSCNPHPKVIDYPYTLSESASVYHFLNIYIWQCWTEVFTALWMCAGFVEFTAEKSNRRNN